MSRGNRKLQNQRRRERNKRQTKPPKQPFLYQLIDGNMSYYPAAFCEYYGAYLTEAMMGTHKCKKRKCKRLCHLQRDKKGILTENMFKKHITNAD